VLLSYEALARERQRGDRLFGRTLLVSLVSFLSIGGYLHAVEVPAEYESVPREVPRARFVLQPEPTPPAAPVPAPPKPSPQVEDLTDTPILAQPETAPPEPEPLQAASSETREPEPVARRVYGLKRVYAKGIGTGGPGAGSILSKRGNTLETAPDTTQATPEDLIGPLAPLSTVTDPPVLTHRVKPVYTEEMIANQVTGTVEARLLVDIDGSVKEVEITADLGHGSRKAARDAFEKLRFRPAQRGDTPVAVWITMKFRFELQG
jgi:TonB family protein